MDYFALLEPVKKVAYQASTFIGDNFGKVSEAKVELKSLNSLVSFVDKEAEKIIVNGLRPLIPDAGFLTEEDTIENNDTEITWIIDPLDGTTNFLHGLPFFAVSIALQVGPSIVLGVVVEVNSNDCYSAAKNRGAFLNEKPISVRKVKDLSDCVIATGFPYYDFDQIDEYIDLLRYFMFNTRGIRRFGSAALDLCYVANGKFDAFFEYGLNPWDVAAGMLIVEEAGGKLCDFTGGNTYYDGKQIIAASNDIFSSFSKIVIDGFRSS